MKAKEKAKVKVHPNMLTRGTVKRLCPAISVSIHCPTMSYDIAYQNVIIVHRLTFPCINLFIAFY